MYNILTPSKSIIEEILQELRISIIGSQVYFLLLTNPNYNISNIAKELNVHRQKIYDSLEELASKEIVKDSKIISPAQVYAMFNQKQADLKNKAVLMETVLPEFLNYYYSQSKSPFVEIFEGKDQFLQLFYKIANETQSELLSIGNIGKFIEMVGLENTHRLIKIRQKNKIVAKMLMFHNEYIDRLFLNNQEELREVKFLDPKYDTNCTIWINQNSVSIWNPLIPRVTSITDAKITEMLRNLHAMIWEML